LINLLFRLEQCYIYNLPQYFKKGSGLKTKLITPEGYKKLYDEHEEIWLIQRPEITKIVTWAASLGDRSENADYQYNKRKLREIDRRVRFLRKLLPELKIINYSKEQEGRVFFGAWVEIENDAGEVKKFRIVGPEEIYGDATGYISIDSPMARALLKKEMGDIVTVKTPNGIKQWNITSIRYTRQWLDKQHE
jgi:transcription elongation factor GreB